MNQQNNKDPLLTRAELARLLHVKPQTIARWDSTKRYDLKPEVKDNKCRYRLSLVSAILQAKLKKAGGRCSN